ncbi:hypothetical protein RND81_03G111000 [Saponaria officinalis]|uniref:Uncharacterized protein n=1 Tax=Saponaria officinalis TaxID=3572 RepID=A0AAW1LZK0_SAPOF
MGFIWCKYGCWSNFRCSRIEMVSRVIFLLIQILCFEPLVDIYGNLASSKNREHKMWKHQAPSPIGVKCLGCVKTSVLTSVSTNPKAGDILIGFLASLIISFAFSMFKQ